MDEFLAKAVPKSLQSQNQEFMNNFDLETQPENPLYRQSNQKSLLLIKSRSNFFIGRI